jgi:YVTN family beta-propeller protein
VVSTETSVLVRVDPKSNLITDRVAVGPNPRFTPVGGGSIWTLNQGDGTVSRVDVKTRKLITNIEVGVPGGGGEIAFGEGYVWVTVFEIPLSQIDPDTNKVIKQWVGLGGDAVRVGHGSCGCPFARRTFGASAQVTVMNPLFGKSSSPQPRGRTC